MTGILVFNQDRPDIALDNGQLYGGLHCGECFGCYIDHAWIEVRLEYNGDWVLLHRQQEISIPYGSLVQI